MFFVIYTLVYGFSTSSEHQESKLYEIYISSDFWTKKKNIRCMFCVFSDINDRILLNQAQQEIFQ